jgi:hypothetical protein
VANFDDRNANRSDCVVEFADTGTSAADVGRDDPVELIPEATGADTGVLDSVWRR